jgi:DNA-binding MarR family transcriptional regulator
MDKAKTRALAQQVLEIGPAIFHTLRSIAPQADGVATTVGQMRCLLSLRAEPQSLSSLASHHGVSAPAMSRMVSELVARGWVSRVEALGDRRQVVLELLPPGRDALHTMHQQMLDQIAVLLENLTPQEQDALALGLRGLLRVVCPAGESAHPQSS